MDSTTEGTRTEDESISASNATADKELTNMFTDYYLSDMHRICAGAKDPMFSAPVVVLCAVVATALVGNGLVLVAVGRQRRLRTPRYLCLANVALADALLCLVSALFHVSTFLGVCHPLSALLPCKVERALEANFILVSAFSFVTVAAVRYREITSRGRNNHHLPGVLFCIWLSCPLLTSPLIFFRPHYFYLHTTSCYEKWPQRLHGPYYSVFSLVFQTAVPLLATAAIHALIAVRLRTRFESLNPNVHRTNTLLFSAALIFCFSWLPLNVIDVAESVSEIHLPNGDSRVPFWLGLNTIGLFSACCNPILYGCFDDAFREEFRRIFSVCRGFGNQPSGVRRERLTGGDEDEEADAAVRREAPAALEEVASLQRGVAMTTMMVD